MEFTQLKNKLKIEIEHNKTKIKNSENLILSFPHKHRRLQQKLSEEKAIIENLRETKDKIIRDIKKLPIKNLNKRKYRRHKPQYYSLLKNLKGINKLIDLTNTKILRIHSEMYFTVPKAESEINVCIRKMHTSKHSLNKLSRRYDQITDILQHRNINHIFDWHRIMSISNTKFNELLNSLQNGTNPNPFIQIQLLPLEGRINLAKDTSNLANRHKNEFENLKSITELQNMYSSRESLLRRPWA